MAPKIKPERRAWAVADFLIAQDPNGAACIAMNGRDEADPFADNGSKDGRRLNRRVMLQVIGKKQR